MFKHVTNEECERINRLQADYFSTVKDVFDPPYPEGVPRRLEIIVRAGDVRPHDTVADIGTGTGVLIPLIRAYTKAPIYANDLSQSMLDTVTDRYHNVIPLLGGIRKLALPDASVDVFFINACYPNLVDKHASFTNITRMLKPGGRVIVSHPMGRGFAEFLKQAMPFPIDDFPASRDEAERLFRAYNLRVHSLVNEESLYILRLDRGEGQSSM